MRRSHNVNLLDKHKNIWDPERVEILKELRKVEEELRKEDEQVTGADEAGWGGDEKVRSSKPERFDPIASTKVTAPLLPLVHLHRTQDPSVLRCTVFFQILPSYFVRVYLCA
jgi:hypothetical protein